MTEIFFPIKRYQSVCFDDCFLPVIKHADDMQSHHLHTFTNIFHIKSLHVIDTLFLEISSPVIIHNI